MKLSRNLYFYEKVNLKDTFETRIYLIFFHFSIILINFKIKGVNFPQQNYDNLFFNIEDNLRELGFGDVSVNKKMKDMNKILYDILLKIIPDNTRVKISKNLVLKYFPDLNSKNPDKYNYFEQYFINFYNFCFDKDPINMLKEVQKFNI